MAGVFSITSRSRIVTRTKMSKNGRRGGDGRRPIRWGVEEMQVLEEGGDLILINIYI
jgi:hypothetical protein